jgi:hypothetical protein
MVDGGEGAGGVSRKCIKTKLHTGQQLTLEEQTATKPPLPDSRDFLHSLACRLSLVINLAMQPSPSLMRRAIAKS